MRHADILGTIGRTPVVRLSPITIGTITATTGVLLRNALSGITSAKVTARSLSSLPRPARAIQRPS